MTVRQLFNLDDAQPGQLRETLRGQILRAIEAGYLAPGTRLPSSRQLSEDLGVSRTTVVGAYDSLVDSGVLVSRPRSGYRVAEAGRDRPAKNSKEPPTDDVPSLPEDLESEWRYSFNYDVNSAWRFPIDEWRLATWQALNRSRDGSSGHAEQVEDDFLTEQFRRIVLPRRGIESTDNDILLAISPAHATYLALRSLADKDTVFGFESPTWPQLHPVLREGGFKHRALRLDHEGVVPDEQLDSCKVLLISSTIQYPTCARPSLERKRALLDWAERKDGYIIEYDLNGELNSGPGSSVTLKSLDRSDRVLYVGSFVGLLGYGIRASHLVAASRYIERARAFRNATVGGMPVIEARILGYFIACGYFLGAFARLRQILKARRGVFLEALQDHLPEVKVRAPATKGWLWLEAQDGVDSDDVIERLSQDKRLRLPRTTNCYFSDPMLNAFRLSYRSIEEEDIASAVRLFGETLRTRNGVKGS